MSTFHWHSLNLWIEDNNVVLLLFNKTDPETLKPAENDEYRQMSIRLHYALQSHYNNVLYNVVSI